MVIGKISVCTAGLHIVTQIVVLVPAAFSSERHSSPYAKVHAFAAGALPEVLKLVVALEVSNDGVARAAEGPDGTDHGDRRSNRRQSALDEAEFVERPVVVGRDFTRARIGKWACDFRLRYELLGSEDHKEYWLAHGKMAVGNCETDAIRALAGHSDVGIVLKDTRAAVPVWGK